jgi:hypothetical protein
MTADPSPGDGRVAPEAELKHGAISFLDALVIGLASTSPAYSLAAIIGPIVALVGVHAPGVLLLERRGDHQHRHERRPGLRPRAARASSRRSCCW